MIYENSNSEHQLYSQFRIKLVKKKDHCGSVRRKNLFYSVHSTRYLFSRDTRMENERVKIKEKEIEMEHREECSKKMREYTGPYFFSD